MFMRSLTAAILCACVSMAAQAAEPVPHEFQLGSVVCGSADDYRAAMDDRGTRRELTEAGTCLYIDDDANEDIMQPFVTVLETEGELARVTFLLEHYRRVAMLHRKFTRMRYTGWTSSKNVSPR